MQPYRRQCIQQYEFQVLQKSEKCNCFSFCLKATTELDITKQSGREFHTLTMRLTNIVDDNDD